jgi:MFS family permease
MRNRRVHEAHPWLGFAVLALPTLLLSVDSTVLYLALPSITRALKASPVEQLWILDIYSFGLAGFLVPIGSLGDRIREASPWSWPESGRNSHEWSSSEPCPGLVMR